MSQSTYTILDFDTKLLGAQVARLETSQLSIPQLKELLHSLKMEGVSLVYWASQNLMSEKQMERLGGLLVDYKTTYVCDPSLAYTPSLAASLKESVHPYHSSMPPEAFASLAVQLGVVSRFGVDPSFPSEQRDELYRLWMQKSLALELADEVLVVMDEKSVTGAVTLRILDGVGSIVLIAVAPEFQKQGFGRKLVKASQLWAEKQGARQLEVVTQRTNEPACQLYESCGFRMKQVVYFYHFWL